MALPDVVSRDQWLEARRALLAREKELTRQRDALNADRRRLPMVRIEKRYLLEGPRGQVTLATCSVPAASSSSGTSCSVPTGTRRAPPAPTFINELPDAVLARLRSLRTAFALVSRAPLAKIEAYRAAQGWTVPWYSSYGSDFNYDFEVSLDEAAGQLQFNYRPEPGLISGERSCEMSGASCFLREGDDVFHTYSAYARGLDHTDLGYALLDLTAFGRQEDWEEPKGRLPAASPA